MKLSLTEILPSSLTSSHIFLSLKPTLQSHCPSSLTASSLMWASVASDMLLPLSLTPTYTLTTWWISAAAAAKSLQLCLTLCDRIEGSPPGSSVPGILQARTLEWVAISFSNTWKWKVKVKVKSFSHVRLFETPWTEAYQAPRSMGFSRQEYWISTYSQNSAPPLRATSPSMKPFLFYQVEMTFYSLVPHMYPIYTSFIASQSLSGPIYKPQTYHVPLQM